LVKGFEPLRRGLRVIGAGDRAHDDDSARASRQHLRQPLLVDSADCEPRFVRCQFGRGANQVEAGRWAARFGGGRPARADAEIVDGLGDCGFHLCTVVGRPADHRSRADDAARDRQR